MTVVSWAGPSTRFHPELEGGRPRHEQEHDGSDSGVNEGPHEEPAEPPDALRRGHSLIGPTRTEPLRPRVPKQIPAHVNSTENADRALQSPVRGYIDPEPPKLPRLNLAPTALADLSLTPLHSNSMLPERRGSSRSRSPSRVGLDQPLLQLEVRDERRVVLRHHGDAVAVAGLLRRLPVVDELPADGVVAEAGAAGCDDLDFIEGRAGVADD